ncbi:hypothetical protein LER48_11875 [Pseudomonas aeruginosa]
MMHLLQSSNRVALSFCNRPDIDREVEGLEEQVAAIDQQLSGLGVVEPESRKPLVGVPFVRGSAHG